MNDSGYPADATPAASCFMSNVSRVVGATLAVSLSALGGWGCQSLTAPAGAGFASVKIGGKTVEQIHAATVSGFQNEGYRAELGTDGLVFEREGSRWDEIAYGSNLGRDKLLNRVRAQVVDLGNGTCRLQCTAYAVRCAGPRIEDETKLPHRRSGYYQGLLEQVAQKLSEGIGASP